MKTLQEGDRERAPHPGLGRVVEVIYRRQWARVHDFDLDVFTLVGVYEPTGEVLVWPPQATPDIAAALKARDAATAHVPVQPQPPASP